MLMHDINMYYETFHGHLKCHHVLHILIQSTNNNNIY